MTDPSPVPALHRWTAFVNVATVVWFVLFGLSFVPSDRITAPWVETLSLGLLSVFVMAQSGVGHIKAGKKVRRLVR